MARRLITPHPHGSRLLLAVIALALSSVAGQRPVAASNAVAGALPNVVVATAQRTTSPAVSWAVDHDAKTITVTVNIAVFVTRQPTELLAQQGLAAAAARIEADIRAVWAGLMFKCYAFIVEPHVRLASGEDDIGTDEFGVELDPAIYPGGTRYKGKDGAGSKPVRSYVGGAGDQHYLSDEPSTVSTLETGPQPPDVRSVWALFTSAGTYAHEFGHLLLLHDNYNEDAGFTQREGAAGDVMFRHARHYVSPETVTKVIRISGEVDESTIKCPFSIDLPDTMFGLPTVVAGTAGGTIGYHAWACDYDPPSSDPNRRTPIGVSVLFRGYGGANAGPFGGAEGGGVSEFNVLIPPPSVGGSSQFIIDFGSGGFVATPLRIGRTGLQGAGPVVLGAGGGELSLNVRPTVSQGAPECE